MFGPQQVYQDAEKAYAQGVSRIIQQAQAQQNVGQQPPKQPPKIVDLCDTCAPIWYERVDRLCRASDAKEENNA